MSELGKYLTEQILLEDNSNIKNIVVIYPGRFQPFHKGHHGVYEHLTKKFGTRHVYIGTSNVVKADKSPFNFKEKMEIMNTMFSIPTDKIVQVKSPYGPAEILSMYDADTTAMVVVVSQKDADRLSNGKYYSMFDGIPTKGHKTNGYVYVCPMFGKGVSATEVRETLSGTDEVKMKKFFQTKVYDKYNEDIYNMITNKLSKSIVIEKKTIEEWLLNESTKIEAGAADDGPTFMYPNFDIFDKVSVQRAKKIGYEVVDMIMNRELQDYYEHPTYPSGPVQAVSYYPAGVMGAKTPNNQIDIYSNGAYSKWYKHVTRKATLSGYELIYTQLERNARMKDSKLAGSDATGDKKFINQKEPNTNLDEAITLPIEIGDTLLMGKFKNKKVVVKSIGVDDHGVPTINGKKVFTFRYGSKKPNIFNNEVVFEIDELLEDVITGFKNLNIPRSKMPQIESKDMPNFLKYLKENSISYQKGKVKIQNLKLTQKDINPDKIEKMMTVKQDVLSKPIIISKDNYIMDGHHRVLAKYALNKGDSMDVYKINLPMKELLKVARKYENVDYKTVHEVMTINEASNKLKLTIPSDIKKIHKAFKKSGKKLYIVGGAVRDAILGQSPKDFDLATDAKPEETIEIAKKAGFKNPPEVGQNFGVVIVGGHEVATLRKDIGKGRRPDAVDYTDIAGDVKRRDLTINALFYDMDKNEIVDLVGGIADLKDKKIRTVGKASERFDEDPLRKLRALRFQSKLGGKMDSDLLLALKQDPSLKGVSSERIRDEFTKSLKSSKSTKDYLTMLDKIGFTKLILPNISVSTPYINESDYIVLLSWILRKNNVDTIGKALNKLNYTSDEIKDIVFLISLQKFKADDVVQYKKKQKISNLDDNQIIKFSKLIKKDLKKFLTFDLSVKGTDVPDDISGAEIGKWINKKESEKFMNESVNEMAKSDLKTIEKYADSKLSPEDIQFTTHFFDRVNDPRNGKVITPSELIGFFKRLSRHKKEFISFLGKFKEFTITDKKTNINIPLVKQAGKIIAKTVMRKKDWKSHEKVLSFENDSIEQIKEDISELLNNFETKNGR